MAKRALIIGINAYDPPNALPSCVADADAFESLLRKSYGFTDIANLRDRQASNSAMAAGLQQLVKDASAGDELVFYYSGHGFSFEKNGALIEALVPQDANFFDSDQLAGLTSAVPPGVLTVVLDSCFSGGLEKTFLLPNGMVERGFVKRFQLSATQKAFVPPIEGRTLAYRPFGSSAGQTAAAVVQQFQAGKPSDKAFSIVVPAPSTDDRRFLLMSACLADETAAASTSQTEGKSAFTFSLLDRIQAADLAAGPVAALLDAAGKRLRDLGITQTPTLRAPAKLDQQPLLRVQPTPAGSQIDSFSKSFTTHNNGRDIIMDSTTSPAAQKGFFDLATQLAGAIAPIVLSQLQRSPSKGFQGPDAVTIDSKSFASILSGVLTTALPIVMQSLATAQKDFVEQSPVDDKNFLSDLGGAITGIVSSPIGQTAIQVGLQARRAAPRPSRARVGSTPARGGRAGEPPARPFLSRAAGRRGAGRWARVKWETRRAGGVLYLSTAPGNQPGSQADTSS